MERNGDVIAELNQCNHPNYSLLNNSYNYDKYKMCKDDIVTPLFCSASDCLSKSIIMGSEHKSADRYFDEKINLFNTGRDYISNDDFNMPVIESSVDSICDSSVWEKPPILQSFSPIKAENLKPKNNFFNGNRLNNNVDLHKNMSLSSAEDFNVSANDNDIDRKLLLDYEAETSSSSSTEELESCPELKDDSNALNEIDSNHNIKSSVVQDFDVPKLPEIKQSDSNSPVKTDRAMPELIPSLICLDDDDEEEESSVTENKKEQYEIINVADSPEMPTLIPFTSERDEVFQVKTECISDDEVAMHDETDSRDTADEMFQPQVLLRRLSVNNVSKDDKTNILSAFLHNNCNKPAFEGPEIEEIEGVRFFQFRSERDMEEFNRISVKIEADEDMIIPTKTTDITQIKGWRTKFFAPESQFHLLSDEMFDEVKTKDSNQEDKVTANHLNESENKSNEKKELHSEAPPSETKKSPTSTKCNAEELSEDKNDHYDNSSSDSEEDEKKTRFKEIKDDGNKNPLSAFISEELDNYLKHSSTLNISYLQKINPNIIPIPKDAKILSIGKLRKTDDPPLPPHLVFKRKSDSFKVEKIENNSAEPITLDDSPTSPNIITLDESSEESDEDIPVATLLKSKKRTIVKRETSKGCKRNLESESEASAKRLVLRLTKEGSGVSKGYKVSDISCKKEKSASTSRASSPSSGTSSLDFSENIIIPINGSLPIVKNTLFAEKSEKRLVNEFLNNLNMYGTRKDVAMLVQSNQSYFDDGPTLTSKICAKAVTVLVSNKEYFEEKQKSKKKLKTWQKYLPKKIDKENMKMKLKKRKSRIDILLNDAESMIPAERGKRSIRLPARYLDSAVLAASEWVSPVITVDGTAPVKTKQEPIEDLDKANLSDEKNIVVLSPPSSTESSSSSSDSSNEDVVDKAPVKLPQKRSIKIKKTQVKNKKLKDSPTKPPSKIDAKKSISPTNNLQLSKVESSSSDSSDDDTVESINNKIKTGIVNKKITPGKRKKSEAVPVKSSNSAGKALTENVSATKRQKNKGSEIKEIVLDFSPEASPSTKVTNKINKSKTAASYPRPYLMPNCACKHSARTAIFDYNFKQFSCAFCDSMKMMIFHTSNKKMEPNPVNVQVKDDQKNESCVVIKEEPHVVLSEKSTLEKPELPDAQKNQLNISDISTSIPISFSNQFLKQDSKIATVNQNVTSSSSAPSNSVANKYILLLQPVKTAAKTNTVPVLPVRHDLTAPVKSNQSPASPVVTNSIIFNNKSKPPILIRKTSTGLITQNTPSDSSNFNALGSNRFVKMTENSSSHISNSLSCDTTSDRTLQGLTSPNSNLISNTNSSPVSTPVVTAYKVGGNFYICNPMMSSTETKTVIASNALSSAQVKTVEGPVITSVQSVHMDEEKSEETFFQNENAEPSNAFANDHQNYVKKQRQSRRKSPLTRLNYTDNEAKKETEENIDVDIETVDDSCNDFIKQKPINVGESDSDISDNECANIFLSSADKLRSVYSKRNVKERQRRLQIKSGFEALKQSSRWFKNANTWVEILNMAVTVANAQQKSDKMFNLAKKRLKVHNSMLMGKLARLLEGIEPPTVRNKTKMQIIKALALDQDKYQNKKSILPLLSEGYKGCAFSSDSERKKSKLDAPDIEIVVENAQDVPSQHVTDAKPVAISPQMPPVPEQRIPSPQPAITEVRSVAKTPEPDDSPSVQAISSDEVQNVETKPTPAESKDDVEIILESSKDVSVSPTDSTKTKFEGLKQKVKEALEKNDKEESSDSDTEELGSDNFNLSGISDDDFDLKISTEDKKENSANLSSDSFNLSGISDDDFDLKICTEDPKENSADEEKTNKSSAQEYPDGETPIQRRRRLNRERARRYRDRLKDKRLDREKKVTKQVAAERLDREKNIVRQQVAAENGHNVRPNVEHYSGPMNIRLMSCKALQYEVEKSADGLIPLFHHKVLKNNLSPSQSPVPPKDIAGESSLRTNSSPRKSSNAPGTVTEEIQIDDDDDDEVAILNSPAIPSSLGGARGHLSSSKDEAELSLAAKTANKLFGPCTVQKVQLKNGQTVFAYNPKKEDSEAAEASTSSASTSKSPAALQTNANGIRNLTDIFSNVFNKSQKRMAAVNRKRVIAPEEIVLLDSSDEEPTEAKSGENASKTSSPSKKSEQNDEQNQGDKEDSPSSS